jgi:hypothetical protein
MKPRFSQFAAGTVFLVCAARALCVPTPTPTAEESEFFEKHVRPILVDRCYECHSTASKTKGGLALDSREAMLKGGDSGRVLEAGDPGKSRLIEAVRYGNRDFQMPPKKRLSDPEIKALETWIKMGAPDPRTETAVAKPGTFIDVKEGRKFWSFTPLARVQPPKVQGTESPIDAFVQAKLREHHLPSAAPADKRTLLRRATYDLTGLPPTPQEMEVFLADDSPEAFERVIESLLASPQYGERWGRHWLDVVRYADSNGMDENVAFGHAWRYRDYVVRAFNQDKPFDTFLIEQIAGDLLPRSEESIVATGFLALGARVLAEPDVQKLEMDIIDEQIDTIGKTFLGMTLGCVRCHDHKFDPISQEDYYGLAAIFRSTRSLSYEKTGAIKYWYEHSLASPAEMARKKETDAQLKDKQAEVTSFLSKARSEVKRQTEARAADYLAAATQLATDAQLKDALVAAKPDGLRPEILLACRKQLEQHRELPLLAEWWKLLPTRDPRAVRAHYAPLLEEALKTKAGPAYAALIDPKGFLALPVKEAEVLDAAALASLATLRKEIALLEAARPELPAAMGVAESKILQTIPIHIRGNHLTLGKPVERGFPEVMQTGASKPILSQKQSGRLELARWLASSENPLTARVLVNRIWRWHFGQGIVGSTDNFGTMGSKPSHPELLDWLARRFIEGGWSIKELHRQIMLSAVYQQSSDLPWLSAAGQDPRLVDPENKLLWRANIQRLEAEQLRDAMLSTCGWLSPEMGGKTVPLRNREFVFNHTSKDATTYESARRTLYVPIIRNHLYDMLEQFDYPDPTMPTGSRNSTVIAPQALLMMNAPLVLEASKRLAARLEKLASAEERIEEAYALLYGRSPLPEELREALRVVGEFARTEMPERAWALFCHALYASNEFAYLR